MKKLILIFTILMTLVILLAPCDTTNIKDSEHYRNITRFVMDNRGELYDIHIPRGASQYVAVDRDGRMHGVTVYGYCFLYDAKMSLPKNYFNNGINSFSCSLYDDGFLWGDTTPYDNWYYVSKIYDCFYYFELHIK